MNWDKEIAKAERAMARNKANIMSAPTSRGTGFRVGFRICYT